MNENEFGNFIQDVLRLLLLPLHCSFPHYRNERESEAVQDFHFEVMAPSKATLWTEHRIRLALHGLQGLGKGPFKFKEPEAILHAEPQHHSFHQHSSTDDVVLAEAGSYT